MNELSNGRILFQDHLGTCYDKVNDVRLKQFPHKGTLANERLHIQGDSKRKHRRSCIELLPNATPDFSARNNQGNWFRFEQNDKVVHCSRNLEKNIQEPFSSNNWKKCQG